MPAPTIPQHSFDSSFLFDVIVIGAGPAGLSAALALCRMAHPTVVFSTGTFRNDKAHRAHTILSRDHQPASEARRIGREQIEAYGTTHFVERALTRACKDEEAGVFEVEDETGEKWRGRKIILAMGAKDIFPEIEGYADCWGASIYHPMSIHYVTYMMQFGCESVTIFRNGSKERLDNGTEKALRVAKMKGAKVDDRRISRLVHDPNQEGLQVVFEDGDSTLLGFLGHQPPTEVVAPDLIEGLGVKILRDGRNGTLVKRNEPFGETNVKGVFVAGDAGTALKQFTTATMHGTFAGAGVAFQLGQEEEERWSKQLDLAELHA